MRRLSSHRRYWKERSELAIKAVLASCLAWLVARYLLGHDQPFFAPLAALLGEQASQVAFSAVFALLSGGHQVVPYVLPRLLNALEQGTANLRSVASTLSEANELEAEVIGFHSGFRKRYAELLQMQAGLVRRIPESAPSEDLDEADRLQGLLEEPHLGPGTDAPGLWDPQKELIRLSRIMLDNVRTPLP